MGEAAVVNRFVESLNSFKNEIREGEIEEAKKHLRDMKSSGLELRFWNPRSDKVEEIKRASELIKMYHEKMLPDVESFERQYKVLSGKRTGKNENFHEEYGHMVDLYNNLEGHQRNGLVSRVALGRYKMKLSEIRIGLGL